MGLKDILARMKEKREREKEQFKQMQKQKRWNEKLEAMDKSSNERELEKFMNEEREKEIKQQLDYMRKKRRDEISFDSNPIDTPSIMKAKWEVMKEKNQFANNGQSIMKGEFIHKTNKNLLKNNKSLMKGGNDLKLIK